MVNVHYYAGRISSLTRWNRRWQFLAAIAASGTIASVIRDVPPGYRWLSIGVSVLAAVAAAILPTWNLSESIGRAERMHSAYKMLYHSTETLAKQTIGGTTLSPDQEAVACMLEMQLAALGPQDEIDPDPIALERARLYVEQQLPDSYFYPQNA
jgi:hypothetical protein